MNHVELVAMLRSKARKSGQQTSIFRGVSLLKQTKKWHAQINVTGKQVSKVTTFSMSEVQILLVKDSLAYCSGSEQTPSVMDRYTLGFFQPRSLQQELMTGQPSTRGLKKMKRGKS